MRTLTKPFLIGPLHPERLAHTHRQLLHTFTGQQGDRPEGGGLHAMRSSGGKLRQAIDAVWNAILEPWSNSQVEVRSID